MISDFETHFRKCHFCSIDVRMRNGEWKIKSSLVWTYIRWRVYLHPAERLTKCHQLPDDNKHELWLQQWPWKGIIGHHCQKGGEKYDECWGRNGEYVTEGEREERWEKCIWKMTKIMEYYFAYYFTTFSVSLQNPWLQRTSSALLLINVTEKQKGKVFIMFS